MTAADPGLLRGVREHVAPLLRTYPRVRVWWPGCGDGAGVCGLAAVLHEEGLLPRATLYATDEDEGRLSEARERLAPRPDLREHISLAHYNLATDASFNEFHLIVCRDVLGGLDEAGQGRALGLFHESLCRLGVLALGPEDAAVLARHPLAADYDAIGGDGALRRRVR